MALDKDQPCPVNLQAKIQDSHPLPLQAEEFGHSENREFTYLFVHSVLHLLGYDHMDENERRDMRNRENEILDKVMSEGL